MAAAPPILRFALCLSAIDCATLALGGERAPVVMRAVVIAVGPWLLLASLVALALSGLASITSVEPARSPSVPTLKDVLWLPGEGQNTRVATLLGIALVSVLLAPPTFGLCRLAIDAMVQPHFAAIAVMGIHALAVGVGAALLPRARALSMRQLPRAQRLPLVGPGLRTLGRALLLAASLSTVLGAAVVAAFWGVFVLMPWETIVPPTGALVLGGLWSFGCSRGLPLWPRGRVVVALAVVALLGILGYGSVLDDRGANLLARGTPSGALGYAALQRVLDLDGDGSLGLFGGGDCAPRDASRHPGAIDTPDNGVDEDCSGADLTGTGPAAVHRIDYPLPQDAERRPPIFLITVDAFAAYRMKAFGGKRDLTPNLDRLMLQSAVFEHCFSQGPSTRLSFPSIFLSRHDTRIHRELARKPPHSIGADELTLAEVMQQVGYATRAVVPVKYFMPEQWPGLTQGFDSVLYRRGSSPSKSGMVSDTGLADLRQFVKTHKGQALFAWLHYFDTHHPHEQPASFPSLGPDEIDIYDAELQLVDREIGRVLDWIDEAYGKRAVIVVTGDHGSAFDAPRHTRHNYGEDLYSATLHVPLIIRAPWLRPQRHSRLCSTMDVMPTLVNLLGARPEVKFDGYSLVPQLLGKPAERPRTLVHQFYLAERLRLNRDPLAIVSLRTDRHHLIHNRQAGSYELYDWTTDFFETRNLAKQHEHAALLGRLQQELGVRTSRLHRWKKKGAK